MITEIRRLTASCKMCGKPADFEITRTNSDLPPHYYKGGSRVETYCIEHLPEEAKRQWNFNIPDMPDQQLK